MLFTYFKGWYFKCSSRDTTVAFIPAVHSDGLRKTASLQIITPENTLNIPFEDIDIDEKKFRISLGGCRFSKKGIFLNIKEKNMRVIGKIRFGAFHPVKYDVMGPFRYVPFLECRHSVQSMQHTIKGDVIINGKKYCFDSGRGYIEGDRGYSFPGRYMWTQCGFKDGSLMLCTADIRIGGACFTGVICVIVYGSHEYRLATYLGAQVEFIGHGRVVISQGGLRFSAQLAEPHAQELAAPENGVMCRRIRENIRCTACYRLEDNGKCVFNFKSTAASFEYEYKR
ncbi:MAG: hypothetical protein Q4F95_10085 [Oscillospiraceae bacterium]|nr:hypothetical protein [Oscillospiraceae bacterium]